MTGVWDVGCESLRAGDSLREDEEGNAVRLTASMYSIGQAHVIYPLHSCFLLAPVILKVRDIKRSPPLGQQKKRVPGQERSSMKWEISS